MAKRAGVDEVAHAVEAFNAERRLGQMRDAGPEAGDVRATGGDPKSAASTMAMLSRRGLSSRVPAGTRRYPSVLRLAPARPRSGTFDRRDARVSGESLE